MSDQQQGKAPATAAELLSDVLGYVRAIHQTGYDEATSVDVREEEDEAVQRYAHLMAELEPLITAYAERVAEERMAEAVAQWSARFAGLLREMSPSLGEPLSAVRDASDPQETTR